MTLETYGVIAESYAERNRDRAPNLLEFLDRFAAALGAGATVLEVGSGPGFDADHLQTRGVTVRRTDATPAFVAMQRARGADAYRLDVRVDPLGGPHDGILADAVLLHLSVDELGAVLPRLLEATRPGGRFALTLKEGDGAELTSANVGHPRWFTYWREPALRTALTDAGWAVDSVEHVSGARAEWLQVLARRPAR